MQHEYSGICLSWLFSRYVKSKSSKQLQGDNVTASDTGDCAPKQFLNDDENLPINPCGLVAWSFFNDTYEVRARRAEQQ